MQHIQKVANEDQVQAHAACLVFAMAMILVKEIPELPPELHTLLCCSLHLL